MRVLFLISSALFFFVAIFFGEVLFQRLYPFPTQVKYGVTFSPKAASSLQLDWKDIYIKVLDDLRVRYLRIPSYWDILEPKLQDFDFSQVDFMLSEAQKRGARVILVLGVRQPRWPECHIPDWAKKLTISDRQKKLLQFIESTVQRYNDHPAIWAWQVENEPLLKSFGKGCDDLNNNFLRSEVNLVRSLSKKPIILTDSGELGLWIIPMGLSDIFGTTLYRDVYNPVLGYSTYPILPYFYKLKSSLARLFTGTNKKTIIIELQAEPWSPGNNLLKTPVDKQISLFSLEKFKKNIIFAKNTGFDEDYLWGVEWWFWMGKQGYTQYLEYAKTLYRDTIHP